MKQLTGVCQAIANAADRLPHLAHISMGMELDALLSSSSAAGVSPLAALTQLTSLAFVEYQVRHTAVRSPYGKCRKRLASGYRQRSQWASWV